jgi:DNA-binding beta-propeller fold protein YncE
VANSGYSNNVTEINSSGTTLLGRYAVGSDPIAIAIAPSGNVWVANAGSDTVTKLPSITSGPYFPYSGPQWP